MLSGQFIHETEPGFPPDLNRADGSSIRPLSVTITDEEALQRRYVRTSNEMELVKHDCFPRFSGVRWARLSVSA
jgi:hypothetical protein